MSIEKIIKTEKFTKEELEILEYIYKQEYKGKKTKHSAEIKVIQEAKHLLELRSCKQEAILEEDNRLKIGNVLIEITDEKIEGNDVELSTKIKEAMFDEYIRDLLVYNESFLDLVKNSDIEHQYITVYSNYEEKE